MLEFWRENDVFAKTLEQTKERPRFSFNEGPPTANGKPGIHHVLARTFKDIFPRYKTMRGFYAPRKAGWDTHGLPVEHEIEKKLGIFDKQEIEDKVGIDEFTRLCRESVMTYIGDWEKMTERMGFWVNLDEAYYTLDNSFIESVWYLLKEIWDKDLIYRGYKVVPYDPRIGATLSSHELAQGYEETEDPSVTVRFKVPVRKTLRSWSGPPRHGHCRPTWRSLWVRRHRLQLLRNGRRGSHRCRGAARIGHARPGAQGYQDRQRQRPGRHTI